MKIVGIFLAIVLCAGGVFAGLLFTHKLPASKFAKSSPAAAAVLAKLGLLHPAKNSKTASARQAGAAIPTSDASPATSQADADEKQSLDAERQQIAAEQAALEKSRAAAAAQKASEQLAPLAPKLADIYDTMSPDDLARIFAKQGDNQVVTALSAMDEKKAGKVMAAMTPDRAAKLALLLNSAAQTEQAGTAPA